uniref:COP9 signalosome complex subunit 9 n=1 Tax=Catharus ustulatus TaxID=91951 RepID=A0A8C3TWZ2_CATUS
MVPRRGGAQRLLSQAGGSTGLLMDLAANEKAVHADFFNGKDRPAPGVVPANRAWLLSPGFGAWWSLKRRSPHLWERGEGASVPGDAVGAVKCGLFLS